MEYRTYMSKQGLRLYGVRTENAHEQKMNTILVELIPSVRYTYYVHGRHSMYIHLFI